MAVPSEMKAWRVHAYGEEGNPADTISKMTLDTIPMPEPKPGQVLIKVELAAVNPIDWKLFSGGMHGICPVTFPYVPGFDVAGTVVKLGEGVGNVQVGDEVIADLGLVETCKTESPCGPAGAFAQYTVALASTVAKREGIPAKELVGLPLAGLTSYQALFTGAGGDFTGAPLGTLAPGDHRGRLRHASSKLEPQGRSCWSWAAPRPPGPSPCSWAGPSARRWPPPPAPTKCPTGPTSWTI
ncbi:unnamed protein product [Effrenium voratum]|nr:unnamed protein product [Effrenium voratum]CAJ1431384.1 unnamed protein product [Effrenium voratum]